MILDIKRKVKDRYLLHRYVLPFIKKNSDRSVTFNNTICLFSFIRSGSTWLTEMLLSIPNSCLFHEPLMRSPIDSPNSLPKKSFRKVNAVSELEFYYYQPIPEDALWTEAEIFFETLLKGRAVSLGLYNDYGLKKLKDANIFIVKQNHSNLHYRWLAKRFSFASIFLIRNPYACIASILRHPFSNKISFSNDIKIPEFRFNEIYRQHERAYSKIVTIEEYYTFLWCLNTIEGPLNSQDTNSIIIFYEDLLLDFENQISTIFKYLQKPVPQAIWDSRLIPSQSTEKYSLPNIEQEKQIYAWKNFLNQDQIKRISNMLNYFEIELYDTSGLPIHKSVRQQIKC